jgi:hypothetical protein
MAADERRKNAAEARVVWIILIDMV